MIDASMVVDVHARAPCFADHNDTHKITDPSTIRRGLDWDPSAGWVPRTPAALRSPSSAHSLAAALSGREGVSSPSGAGEKGRWERAFLPPPPARPARSGRKVRPARADRGADRKSVV